MSSEFVQLTKLENLSPLIHPFHTGQLTKLSYIHTWLHTYVRYKNLLCPTDLGKKLGSYFNLFSSCLTCSYKIKKPNIPMDIFFNLNT
jgi:hypothetical protein